MIENYKLELNYRDSRLSISKAGEESEEDYGKRCDAAEGKYFWRVIFRYEREDGTKVHKAIETRDLDKDGFPWIGAVDALHTAAIVIGIESQKSSNPK